MTRMPKKPSGAEYYAYLNGPVWKAIRARRLKLDGFKCRKCGSVEVLQVHHRTYLNWGGQEKMEDLITLCKKCHMLLHRLLDDRPFVSVENMTRRFMGEPIRKRGHRPAFRSSRGRNRPPLWKDKS